MTSQAGPQVQYHCNKCGIRKQPVERVLLHQRHDGITCLIPCGCETLLSIPIRCSAIVDRLIAEGVKLRAA